MFPYTRAAALRLVAGALAAAVSAAPLTAMPALAAEAAAPVSLESLLSSAGGAKAPALGQVDRIDLGSRGATVTLEGGETVRLDFSGLTGVSGGPNYLGWGMVLFGMSVATRLLSTVARVIRPFAPRRSRRRYDDD